MYEYHKVGVDAVKHRTLVSVTEIVGFARHLRQKTPHSVSEAGSVSVFKSNAQRREPTLLDLSKETNVSIENVGYL
jgi:hypothetical protein